MLFRLIRITRDPDRFIRIFENRTVNDTTRGKQPTSPGGQLEEPSRTGSVEKHLKSRDSANSSAFLRISIPGIESSESRSLSRRGEVERTL
jgi:hypothetical protein